MNAAPQALQVLQAVAQKPGLQAAIGAHLLLQGLERFQPRRQLRLAGRGVVHILLLTPALRFQLGQRILQFLQARLCQGGRIAGLRQLVLQVAQSGFVWRGQGIAVGLQAFKPTAQLTRLLLDVALLGSQHLDLLLHLRDAGPLVIGTALCQPKSVFELGQLPRLVFHLGSQQLRLLGAGQGLIIEPDQFSLSTLSASGPLKGLVGQRLQPLLDPLTPLDHEADLCLEPADFGTGLIQQTLGLVHLVACRVVGLAHRL